MFSKKVASILALEIIFFLLKIVKYPSFRESQQLSLKFINLAKPTPSVKPFPELAPYGRNSMSISDAKNNPFESKLKYLIFLLETFLIVKVLSNSTFSIYFFFKWGSTKS